MLHYPLLTDPDAFLLVGNKSHVWAEGQPLVFDDSYRHEGEHNGNDARVVLYMTMWHPDLGKPRLLSTRDREDLSTLLSHNPYLSGELDL